jgi:hypothetical protein
VEVDPAQVQAYIQTLLTGPPPSKTSPAGTGKGAATEDEVVVQNLARHSPDQPITAGGIPCVN